MPRKGDSRGCGTQAPPAFHHFGLKAEAAGPAHQNPTDAHRQDRRDFEQVMADDPWRGFGVGLVPFEPRLAQIDE